MNLNKCDCVTVNILIRRGLKSFELQQSGTEHVWGDPEVGAEECKFSLKNLSLQELK